MKVLYTKEEAERFVRGDYDEEALMYLSEIEPRQCGGLSHMLHCLKSIVAELIGLYPAGGFGQAVIRNDLGSAVARADSQNIFCLKHYIIFLHNKVPAKWLWDAKERLEGRRNESK